MIYVFNGIELLEFATVTNGVVGEWTPIENIEDSSISITSNSDSKTNIIPEDKDSPILVLYTPGDPDAVNFAMLELSPENLQRFFNATYDVATSSVIVFAKKKRANLAFRLTSRPQEGFKMRLTYNNTQSDVTYKNNITKNGLLSIAVAASILSWTEPISGNDALYMVETLNEDGTAVDSTPPTVSAGTNATASATPKTLTGASATAAGTKTIASTLWTQVSGPNTAGFTAPTSVSTSVTGLVTGVYIFKLTAIDSEGISASAQVTITATIS